MSLSSFKIQIWFFTTSFKFIINDSSFSQSIYAGNNLSLFTSSSTLQFLL